MISDQEYDRETMKFDLAQEQYNLAREAYIKQKKQELTYSELQEYLELPDNAFDVKFHPTFGGESKYQDPQAVGLYEAVTHYAAKNDAASREQLGYALVRLLESRIGMEFDYDHDVTNYL